MQKSCRELLQKGNRKRRPKSDIILADYRMFRTVSSKFKVHCAIVGMYTRRYTNKSGYNDIYTVVFTKSDINLGRWRTVFSKEPEQVRPTRVFESRAKSVKNVMLIVPSTSGD